MHFRILAAFWNDYFKTCQAVSLYCPHLLCRLLATPDVTNTTNHIHVHIHIISLSIYIHLSLYIYVYICIYIYIYIRYPHSLGYRGGGARPPERAARTSQYTFFFYYIYIYIYVYLFYSFIYIYIYIYIFLFMYFCYVFIYLFLSSTFIWLENKLPGNRLPRIPPTDWTRESWSKQSTGTKYKQSPCTLNLRFE